MHIKMQKGQAAILTILIMGVILSGLIFYGWWREDEFSKEISRLDSSQVAHEVLTGAAKRVQQLYMNEAGCDPDRLDTVLKSLPTLPTTYSASIAYVVADPTATTAVRRNNLCTATSGCRQFVVEQDNRAYVVRVGRVSALAKVAGTAVCARDTTVKLRTTIRGFAYSRNATLLNLCSYNSCAGVDYTGVTSTISANTAVSTACGQLPSRQYGDMVGTGSLIDENDLRWARRYLETGASDIGFTNYLATTSAIASGNGSCTPAASVSQCTQKNCIPTFDLDLNKTNNEADLAILEYYLRGYLTSLPVKNF